MPLTLIEGMMYILGLRVILNASVILDAIVIFIVEPILGYIIQQFGSSQQQEIERSTGYINENETRLEKEILFEKRIDSVLERGILASFPEDKCLQRIVRKEFLKSNQCEDDQPKVDRLAIKAIKSIMHEKMMTDEMDLYSKSIYKLIFKETLSDWNDLFEKKTSEEPLENSTGVDNRKSQLDRLRSDGPIIFSIMSQTIPRLFHGSVNISVCRNSVYVSIDKYKDRYGYLIDENCFLDIPHRDGFEYDTYWAEKFTKLAMSRYSKDVYLGMSGMWLPSDQENSEYMYNFLNKSIIDKLPRVIPSEGWRQYISKEQPVWKLSQSVYITIRDFHFCRKVVYSESDSSSYWGYLRDD